MQASALLMTGLLSFCTHMQQHMKP